MNQPKSRSNGSKILLSLILLVAASAVVVGGYAAFTSVTNTGTNTLTAGTLALSNNANITGTVSDMKPGDVYKRCVKLSNTGSLDASVTVRLGGDSAGTGAMSNTFTSNAIKYSVEHGTGNITDSSSAAGCSPFSPTAAVLGSVSSGAPATSLAQTTNQSSAVNASLSGGIANGASKSFRVMFKLADDATNDDQGKALTYFLVFDSASAAGEER